MNLERQAVQAIQGAVRQQSSEIERQTVQAFAQPLRDIQQAAGCVCQNMKEVSWLMTGLVFSAGLVIGLLFGYWPLRSSPEQHAAAVEPDRAVPGSPITGGVGSCSAPAHKVKAKAK